MVPIQFLISFLFISACTNDNSVSTEQVTIQNPASDLIRITYGDDQCQFGYLQIPEGDGPFPVVMIIHGGCWLSEYDISLMDSMAEKLTSLGYASWNIEYRRIGNAGGGWPGTFHDVTNALAKLNEMAKNYPIDLDRIVLTGHSAGGHLALWLGAQPLLDDASDIKLNDRMKIKGIISLAGIVDLRTYLSDTGCGSSVSKLIGGQPNDFPGRYDVASPISNTPMGVKQILINGSNDNIVPVSHVQPYYDKAVQNNEDIELQVVDGDGHFEILNPGSASWSAFIQGLEAVLAN